MPKVRLFKTPTCPYCNQVKEFLEEHNIEYDQEDVSQSKEAREEMIEKSGQMGVPVIEIDGQIVIGFDKQKLKKLLDI